MKSVTLEDSQILLEESINKCKIKSSKQYGNNIVHELYDGQYCVTYNGKLVVPFGKYAWIDGFDNGLARVRTEGLTNAGGFTIHFSPFEEKDAPENESPQTRYYKEREEHPERFAKWGIINEKGEEVLPVEYDEVWNFLNKGRSRTYVEKNKNGWDFIFASHKLVPCHG